MRQQYQQEIYDYLDRFISGQEAAKDKLAVLGYLYSNRCTAITAGLRPESLPRLNMFLTGPTGTGKTLLGTTLSKCLDIPFIRIDCASLSQIGWEGVSIDQLLQAFSLKLGPEGFGLIMLDEFDKLSARIEGSKGSTPNVGIQNNMLDLLDGKFERKSVHKRINNCLIVCCGAFSEATKDAKKTKRSIGFKNNDLNDPIVWKKVMVDSGMLPEVIGRLIDVISTTALSRQEIRDVLVEKENSTYNKYKNMMMGLDFTDADIDKLVEDTYNSEYGLRELDTNIFKIVHDKLLIKNRKAK